MAAALWLLHFFGLVDVSVNAEIDAVSIFAMMLALFCFGAFLICIG